MLLNGGTDETTFQLSLPAGDWRMIGNGERVLLDGIPDAATIPGGKRLNLRVPANTAHIYMDGWKMTNDETPKPE